MLWALLLAPVVSLLGCAVLLRFAARTFLDHPNARSLHEAPTPRTGGIAIISALLPLAWLLGMAGGRPLALLLGGGLLVFAVSLLDDAFGVPVLRRLAVHFLATALVVAVAPGFPAAPWQVALGFLLIVWGTNLFNFMDGMDGLAGSMALLGGGALAAALFLAGAWHYGALALGAALAAGAFLCFNLPRARLFMGDAGSATLGFLFSAISVRAAGEGLLPAWAPLLIFLPFLADASLTLVVRALRGRRIWQAHREHLYQALVLRGWPVSRVLLVAVAAMLLCAIAALGLLLTKREGWQVLAAFLGMFALIYFGIIGRFVKE